jgi:hypothetical protein
MPENTSVMFVKTSIENYKKTVPQDNILYFTTDTNEFFIGDKKFGAGFIWVTEENPLPPIGVEGYIYVNKNDMAINLWDNKQNNYINLNERLNYITSIYRDINNLYANKSGGSIETVAMDKPLVDLDINALFD